MTPPPGDRTKRFGHRVTAGLPAVVQDGSGDVTCTAHDLSRSGVFLEGDLNYPSGRCVDLTLKGPPGTRDVRVRAVVARCIAATGSTPAGMAVEFLEPTPEQQDGVETLLARTVGGFVPPPLEALRPGAPYPEVRRALALVPIPLRVAFAGRAAAREREFLFQDDAPAVLEALARNPTLTAAEARVLAGLPHLVPSTLEILAGDPRWAREEEVLMAVASNPRTTAAAAEKVVASMTPDQVRRLVLRPGLNPTLRTRLGRRIGRA